MSVMIPTTPLNHTSHYISHRALEADTGHEWTVYYNPDHVDFRPLHGQVDDRRQRAIALADAMTGRNARVYKKSRQDGNPEYGVRVRYDGVIPTFGGDELSLDVS
jgi:hypothetical protein